MIASPTVSELFMRQTNFALGNMAFIGLFQAVADRAGVPLEMNPLMIKIFEDGISRFGPRELSPNIIKRLEEATGLDITAPGFPPEMTDDEPEEPGYEVYPPGRAPEAVAEER